MKQLVRRVIDKSGRILIEDMPTPHISDDQVLISTHYSLISSGTEMGTVQKTPTQLAKQTIEDPWMRQAVKNLVFSGGLRKTIDTIKNELYLYRMIGYSGAGVVLDKGQRIDHVEIGDRVAYAAQGHAEQVAAYANHVVKVPDEVDLTDAAFVTVGGIALQGIRRSGLQIGEWVVIYGLGLVGQLAAQIALAAGARVIGIDVSTDRTELAGRVGIKHTVLAGESDPVASVLHMTGGKGADRTIMCAVSNDTAIANNAMKMTRKQGKVTFIGLVKMDLERMPFFLNELDLSFSRAYGPGSYDDAYEKGRVDYPYQYVRWTEHRNLDEVIRLISDKKIDVKPLVDATFPLEEGQIAIDRIKKGAMKSVAVLLSYPPVIGISNTIHLTEPQRLKKDVVSVGVIGVGNFSRNTRIPNLSRHKGYHLKALCSATGMTAASVAKMYACDYVTTDYKEILADPNVDMVLIATRHNLHAKLTCEAAEAGKHVFVEKPVAMNLEEWQQVQETIRKTGVHYMVGYNRRYSKIAGKAKRYVTQQPILMKYTVNIQHLPDAHWTLDPVEGGGRLLGESDHFFDLMNLYADSKPVQVQALSLPISGDTKMGLFNFMVQVQYENGSMGQLTYTSFGGPHVPKERLEIFCGDKYVEMIDFKKLGVNGKMHSVGGGMGHERELDIFHEQIYGQTPFIDHSSMMAASWISLQATNQK
jgi:predicted dehydrogenase/threonine dehydrogenase-like Zn-dependent dehydrogenase